MLFLVNMLEIMDSTPRNDHEFLCPLLEFFSDLISIPYVDTNDFIRIGFLETLAYLLEKNSHEKVKKSVLILISVIPYAYSASKNLEILIFEFFSKYFKEILDGQNENVIFFFRLLY